MATIKANAPPPQPPPAPTSYTLELSPEEFHGLMKLIRRGIEYGTINELHLLSLSDAMHAHEPDDIRDWDETSFYRLAKRKVNSP